VTVGARVALGWDCPLALSPVASIAATVAIATFTAPPPARNDLDIGELVSRPATAEK